MKKFPVLVLLIACLLNSLVLDSSKRFHPDEALYSTIARSAAIHGDWLFLSPTVDKPPLSFYLNALALTFFAVDTDEQAVLHLDVHKGEFALRIMGIWQSLIFVAVVYALAKALYQDEKIAWLAAWIVTLSPFRLAFSATAFTDMPMLLLATLSLYFAVKGQGSRAGLLLALSLATKPQSIFYLPLLLVFLSIQRPSQNRFARFFLSLGLVLMLLWAWDSLRVQHGAISFYALGQAHYTPTQITPFADYGARLIELWASLQYLLGHAWLTGLGFVVIIVSSGQQANPLPCIATLNVPSPLQWGGDCGVGVKYQNSFLVLWMLAFLMLHIVLTLNLFDRNFLILLPIFALLLARAVFWARYTTPLERIFHKLGVARYAPTLVFILSFFILNFSAPIGGDDGRYTGIDDFADYLNSKPVATVIYNSWLTWELDYYMGEWTNKRRVYYPSPRLLVRDALASQEQGTRYFVAPRSQAVMVWLAALSRAGFTVTLDYESENFLSYALTPP